MVTAVLEMRGHEGAFEGLGRKGQSVRIERGLQDSQKETRCVCMKKATVEIRKTKADGMVF